MAILSREDLRNRLKRREIAPVYLLFGSETYLRDLAAKTIADFALTDSQAREFNEDEFSLNKPENLINALSSAEQLPMMASLRVVKILDVKITSTGSSDNLKEDDEVILRQYLENPAKSSVVIFIADELDKRRKMAKLLIENSVAIEFTELDDVKITQWAREKLTEENIKFDDRALRHLVALVGRDVRKMTNEINKLVTSSLPEKVVSYEMVESLVSNTREINNFALTDRMISGNKAESLEVLKKILDDGAEPLMLLGLIAHNFRRLLAAKDLMRQGVSRTEVVRVMKLHPRFHEDFLATARRCEENYLKNTIKKLAEADISIKKSIGGGKDGARRQIEMLVCDLVS